MALYNTWRGFSDELDLLVVEFEKIAIEVAAPVSKSSFNLLSECALEGLTSRTWQAWCLFCRACVIESCLGTRDGNGAVIAPHPSAASCLHVSAAAIEAKKRKSIVWGGQNSILRFEPTWGDTDALADIVPRLRPMNHVQLSSAFSSAHASAKTLQKIRNAAAHSHAQNLAEVVSLTSSYLAYPIDHSTHALFWVDPASSEYLLINLIEDLRDCALSAIS